MKPPLAPIIFAALIGIIALDYSNEATAHRERTAMKAALRIEVRREVMLGFDRNRFAQQAAAEYLELSDQTSELYVAFMARYEKMVAEDSEMLLNPEWPLIVAREEATRLGRSPAITIPSFSF